MAKDYLKDKVVKKKSALKAVYLLVLLGVVFVVMLFKFAYSGTGVFSGLPDSDAAYEIAKGYIRPTVRSTSVTFHDDAYKFAKKSDSVYVIKSSYDEKDGNGESMSTNFTITLQYLGGHAKNEGAWKMVTLDKE